MNQEHTLRRQESLDNKKHAAANSNHIDSDLAKRKSIEEETQKHTVIGRWNDH
jgi:hypothetical protein